MPLRPRRDGRQGILPFVIERAERTDVTARAGLPLVVETMRALGVDELASASLPQQKRQRGFAPEQKLEAIVTLLAAGGDRVEEVRVLAEDKGLEKLLGAPFPSPDALLDFIGQFHDPKCSEGRPPEKKAWVPPESEGLRAEAGELVVHQSQLSVRVPVGDQRLQEIVEARGHLLAMHDARHPA